LETEELGFETICKLFPLLQPEPYEGDVLKHGTHDQKTHGSWATGSSESDYEMSHRPSLGSGTEGDMDGASLDNVSNGIYPDDVYSPRGVQIYGTGYKELDKQAHALIMEYRGKPEKSIRIYRAIPKDASTSKIGGGEWVTPIKQYAVQHGQSNLNDDYQILTREVKAKEIFTSGDSWLEWGYAPTAVLKHGTHDQSTHGNWANGGGSSESGLDSMPYGWNPEFKERERLTASELSSEQLNLGRTQLQQVADSPITIRVSSGDLEVRKIAEAGRFMSLTEMPEPTIGYEIDYREGRFDLEKGLWGLPTNSNSPIYGYFDTPLQKGVNNMTDMYGDVKIVLRDSVAGRTTISPGDSANHGLTPVLVTDARKGNLSLEQVDSAYRSRHFQREATSVSQPVRSVRTTGEIDYFEAQIHGGVSLSDIKSVRLKKYSIVGDSTIALLEKAGIEVTRDDK